MWLLGVVFLLVLCACEGGAAEHEPPAGDPLTLAQESFGALLAVPLPKLEAALARLQKEARLRESTVPGVEAARAAARLGKVVVHRTRGAEPIERVRRLLTMASKRKALAGACDAAVELARFEATYGQRPQEAFVIAYRTVRRFETVTGQQRCVESARWITRVLQDSRPSAGELAAIDADPDADDPSLIPSELDRAPSSTLNAWVRGQVRREGPQAALQRISTYGLLDDQVGVQHTARVVLEFDRAAVFRRGELPKEDGLPRRVFFDLDGVSIGPEVDASSSIQRAGLRRIRVFRLDATTARVSFDVGDTTAYRFFALTDPFRLIVDFRPRQARARPSEDLMTVVLDPGHGGPNPGARGPGGIQEANMVLDLARRVRARLRAHPERVRVVMTRDGDREVSLEERTAVANAHDADLFVSLHLNASSSENDKGGVSTFYLDTSDDRQALKLAARENNTDESDITELQKVLASLQRKEQVEQSAALARLVQRHTLRAGRRHLPHLVDRGVRRAVFFVLVGASMPAVLLEASFITRPEEAAALRTVAYRQALADGTADGILAYVDQLQSQQQ